VVTHYPVPSFPSTGNAFYGTIAHYPQNGYEGFARSAETTGKRRVDCSGTEVWLPPPEVSYRVTEKGRALGHTFEVLETWAKEYAPGKVEIYDKVARNKSGRLTAR
jgi:hypothetical protein